MRREGFSLVEISVVLVIVATMLAGVLPAITESSKVRAIDQTADRMKEIEDSLQAYFATNSALPCPSDITQAVNNANFGKKAANATCQGGTPAANWGPVNAAGAAGNVVGGGVPTKDLGLPDEVAFDGWGHRFAYHVDRTATVAGTFGTSGAITVNGTGGALRSASAVYVLISAGKNGHGGYGRAATRFDAGSTNADEWSNCQSATATCGGAPASYNATFVQRLEQADSAAVTNKFDDLVVYKLTGHLLAGGPGALWAPSGANIYNTNNGNVGIGTTTPFRKLHVVGGNAPFMVSTTDYNNVNTGSIFSVEFGAASGNTYSSLNALSAGGTAWNNLILQPSGNVGIGTSAPTVPLTIGDATNGNGTLLLNRQNTSGSEGGELELAAGTTGEDMF